MRFFRIPSFTGIETHRDDADRGSLRVVEGCLPHGPGGVRSGPAWEEVGVVDLFSDNSKNILTANDDGQGNSVVVASRGGEVHDMVIFSTENTAVVSLGASYMVADSEAHTTGFATITPVGNRMYSFGDGSAEGVFFGKGPAGTQPVVFPDQELYTQEWSRFPNCQFFVQGPKKTLFGAGNPDSPLTVYISESAGMTKEYRDSPYSTEMTNQIPGKLSTVNILSSDATRITALSTRGDQVVVHTDKGCHLLYAPSPDQASTGYRVEQVPTTNFSAAVNQQVVAGESGSQNFWLGFDGQIYKDEAAARGAEDKKNYTDGSQATWKSKGLWEKHQITDLSRSFATYDPETGNYWLFVEAPEYADFVSGEAPNPPLGLIVSGTPEAPASPTDLSIDGVVSSAPNSPTGLAITDVTSDTASAVTNLAVSELTPDAPNPVTGLDILGPAAGPVDLVLELTKPVSGPTGVSLENLKPVAGPVDLSVASAAPSTGPIDINAELLAPQAGPANLSVSEGIPDAPASGPTDVALENLKPATGPTNLSVSEGIPDAPVAGPSGLTLDNLAPASGPTGLDLENIKPAAGPTDLSLNEEVVSPPAAGPTGLDVREPFIIETWVTYDSDLPVYPEVNTGAIVFMKNAPWIITPLIYKHEDLKWYRYGTNQQGDFYSVPNTQFTINQD